MADSFDEPTLHERMGGRWALSWQAYFITVPFAILTLALWARSPREVLWWIGIGLISMGVVGAWSVLMHRTLFKERAVRPVSPAWVIGSSVVAATLFVVISLALGTLVGISDPGRPVPNPIPTLVFAAGWGVALAMILESQWRFRQQRGQLIEQAVQQRLTALQERELLDQIRQSIQSEVGDEISTARQRLDAQIDALIVVDPVSVDTLVNELRSTADSTVRPLSHRLEQQTQRRHPAPSVFTVIVNIARFQPFRPLAVSVVYLLTVTPTEVTLNGVAMGLGIVATTVAMIVATMSVVNMAMRRWPAHHALLFVGGIAFVQLPTLALAPLKARITGIPISAIDMVAAVVLGSILIVLTSAFGAWNRSRHEAIQEFAAEVREDDLLALARSEVIAQTAREAAVILHGSVQSRLRACAAALDAASRSDDLVGVNRALLQARAILSEPIAELTWRDPLPIGAMINEKAAEWAGLVTIVTEVDESLRNRCSAQVRTIGDVVEEGIANAVHHGGAQHVTVRIDRVPSPARALDEILVRIADDGVGPGSGSAGLGTRMLNRLATDWRLSPAASGGSQLEARIILEMDRSGPANPH